MCVYDHLFHTFCYFSAIFVIASTADHTVHKAPMLVYEIKNDKDLSVVTELAHSSRTRQSYFSGEFLVL